MQYLVVNNLLYIADITDICVCGCVVCACVCLDVCVCLCVCGVWVCVCGGCMVCMSENKNIIKLQHFKIWMYCRKRLI